MCLNEGVEAKRGCLQELEFQAVVSSHAYAGDQIQALCKNTKCS